MGQRELYAQGGLTRWYWDYRDRAVLKHTAGCASVLDVGCGEGVTLDKVRRQDPDRHYCGVDLASRNILTCRKHDLRAYTGNIYNLYNVPAGWDCILLLDVIEHLTDPPDALRKLKNKLGKGGKLVVMFPNDRAWFWARLLCGKRQEAFADHGHVRTWSHWSMKAELEAAGFTVESTERIGLGLHTLMVGRKA